MTLAHSARSLRMVCHGALLIGLTTWANVIYSKTQDATSRPHPSPIESQTADDVSPRQLRNREGEVRGNHEHVRSADGNRQRTRREADADLGADREGGEKQKGKDEEEVMAAGEHEEEASPVDMAIAGMLVGGVSFLMMIFYVVNYDDADIQYYAWLVISSTMSIFTAVQLFDGVHGVFESYVLESLDETQHILASYLFLLAGLVALQVVIMVMARSRRATDAQCADTGDDDDDYKMHMSCWSTLLSHMVAFSSMHAGGALQHLEIFSGTATMTLVAAGVHGVILFILLAFFDHGRSFLARTDDERANSLWLERAREAEDDIASLSMSFIVIQGIRYAMSGVLPNVEGLEEPQLTHPFLCSVGLAGVAMASATVVVLTLWVVSKCRFEPKSTLKRFLLIFQAIAAMAFAWSIFYAMKWQFKRLYPHVHPNSMSARVPLALAVSAGSFGFIFVLDYLEDLDATGEDVDRAIASIICALGFLVGFSWEQSFEGAASCLSSLDPEGSEWTKLFQACIVGLIVIPAWRRYILKACHEHEAKAQRGQGSKRRNSLKQCSSRHSHYLGVTSKNSSNEFTREITADMEVVSARTHDQLM
eukprot:TRINITY_DN8185_c0_g2_i2.p1 TRINITY_DN8185_c0_g2~~TRINITY_DN8185_c0_g2_i2.p1  ORF type:complete len:604 (-),score=32.29 TRINITY_DN8185_c0_g2_i2:203-1978(-)